MKMTVKNTSNFRYGLLGSAALLLATAGCSRSSVQAAPAMPAPLVTVVKATAQDVPKYLDEIGRNAAFESVTVTPQVGGRIVERRFQDGENLKKGQLLFVVDPRPYKAQLDSAQASLAQARAYYGANPKEYEHGVILHIQSISIVPPNQTPAVVKEAKQRAENAIKQAKLAKTYHEFGLLAEHISDDDFHVNMGDHRPQPASALPPPIVKAATKMKAGEVSELIQLGDNYTIFRLEKYTPAGMTPFSEVKAQLQSDLQKKKTEQLRSALGQKLRKNSRIETL